MSATKPRIQCPLCDSTKVEVMHDKRATYRYLKKTLVLEGQEHTVCHECECSFFADGQIERNNERFIAFEQSVVKDISPREIRELREKYMLSQDQAQKIFNCRGVNSFSKWERGEVAPTSTAALLLKLALEDASVMQKLAVKAGETIDIPLGEDANIASVSDATYTGSASNIQGDLASLIKSVEAVLGRIGNRTTPKKIDKVISPSLQTFALHEVGTLVGNLADSDELNMYFQRPRIDEFIDNQQRISEAKNLVVAYQANR